MQSDESSSGDESSKEAAKRPRSSKRRSSSAEIGDYKTTEFSTTSLTTGLTTGKRKIGSKQVTVSQTDPSANESANAKSPGQQKANCGQCEKPIYDEQPMRFDSKSYHRFCFKCSSCNAQLDNASNTAYLCEAEQRFYCIRCCDCKCWLTNAGKPDKEPADNAGQIETGSNENKLISNKGTTRLASPPAPVKPTHIDTTTKKKCKFCNQILPDYLQSSQQTDPAELKAPSEPVATIDQRRTTQTDQTQTDTKLNYKTQTDKAKTNLDSRQFGEPMDSWPAAARRSPNRPPGQQEEHRIRLVKKPAIGPRIARIIDKLENSLNLKTQTERNFQESFYRNVEQSREQQKERTGRVGNLAGVTERKELKENLKESGLPKERRKFGELAGSLAEQAGSLERDLEQKVENKLEQKQNLHPVQPPADRRTTRSTANIENGEPNVPSLRGVKQKNRQPIACPNCKMILPASLFLEQGACRPFCTVHCPHEQPTDAHQADASKQAEAPNQTEASKPVDKAVSTTTVLGQKAVESAAKQKRLNSEPSLNRRKPSDRPAVRAVEELKHHSKPYNLLLPEPAGRSLPGANRLESERKPTREPAEDAKRNPPAEPHLSDQSTTGICCKCGLKVRFNERARPPAPSKCLRCSACGRPLSPGRHSVSPNGEPHCNAPCSSRLHRADSYAFNVKHT